MASNSGVDHANGDSPDRVIAGVLDSLRQSRALLLDPCPQNIDGCRLAVAQCVNKMGQLAEADRSGWNSLDLKAPLLLIRGELSAIASLLDSAAAFRRDMLKVISDATRPRAVQIDAGDRKAAHVHVFG